MCCMQTNATGGGVSATAAQQMPLTSDYPVCLCLCFYVAAAQCSNLSAERDLISLITVPIHMFRSNK